MLDGVKTIDFISHGDDRGQLVAIEGEKDVCFQIRRVYYIYDTCSDVVRGKHAHKDLNQVLLCLNGSCDILLDNGKQRETVTLNDPAKGIYIYGFIWREMMNFSDGCVLMAMVDRPYDIADYINNFDEFTERSSQQ